MSSATLWNPYPTPIFDQNGEIASGAQAYFYSGGTSEPLTVYLDASLTIPAAFPVVATANGVFAPIYLPYQSYRVRVTDANSALIFDADNIANPAPPSSGGGGGIVVSSDMVFGTGDVKWKLYNGSETGWVRMNARTIGSSVSGATERANSDTQTLFLWLWNNLPNSIAPVSTGRGVSASADWSANKTIGVPTMQGLVALGTDDMGGSAAQKIQIVGTCNVVNGSQDITIASTGGLARGMYVIIDGSSIGRITNVSGTTVTLDTPYPGTTASDLSYRASYYADAQTIGQVGGSQSFTATTTELPAHTHGTTESAHTHDVTVGSTSGGTLMAGATNAAPPGATVQTSGATTGLTINSAGSGLPIQILPPGRLGTFFMKL